MKVGSNHTVWQGVSSSVYPHPSKQINLRLLIQQLQNDLFGGWLCIVLDALNPYYRVMSIWELWCIAALISNSALHMPACCTQASSACEVNTPHVCNFVEKIYR